MGINDITGAAKLFRILFFYEKDSRKEKKIFKYRRKVLIRAGPKKTIDMSGEMISDE